uniref:Solute carrier organic anion transporter family, member 2B1 n=1 Tax=Gadus morhua TaxID=8049 RepID=A0A8C5ASJ1_GADMO
MFCNKPFDLTFFVFCQGFLQLAQLMVSGCLKSSVSTIERRYGFTSQELGLLVAFNEVGNVMLIMFVSFFGSRVHRPRLIGAGALLASVSSLIIALPHFLSRPYQFAAHPGILLAVTSLGPAAGFMMGSFTLRFYVDFDKTPTDQIQIDSKDLRWVGAWWLGFLIASCLLFLTSLPYLFFPRTMRRLNQRRRNSWRWSRPPPSSSSSKVRPVVSRGAIRDMLWCFPRIALRTLQNPVFMLMCLGQVFCAGIIVGVVTFLAKFMERQFNLTASYATMLIGVVHMPVCVAAIVIGGAVMRRLDLSRSGAAKWCSLAIICTLFVSVPLLFIGCPTQRVAGVFPTSRYGSTDGSETACSGRCECPQDAFNPVCASDGTEFRSPCHAGCIAMETDSSSQKVQVRTQRPLSPALSIQLCLIVSVPPEDKSFAVGVCYMLFRVLAFLPTPVIYGSVIDSSCILWGRKCGKKTSCQYYDLDSFRHRQVPLAYFIKPLFTRLKSH